MKGNSKKTTEEKKNEKKMTNADLMQFLGKYDSIIKDKMISDNAKKVLSCLLYVGSKQNESFTIGQRTISELTGVPKNKISANISILVDKGFINCNVGERGKNSEYTINYEAMKSYVSLSVPSVPKCTGKVSQVSQSVPSVPKDEGTVKRTVEGTPKDAEIQRVMERIEVYQKCINEELGTLKKIVLGDININNNININLNNLKDIISNNDNTEEYNIKDQNIKEKSTTDNLEKLKENTKVKSSNDEIIPSENKILNENRIPSEDNISDNEIPSDLPPLNIDDFFENSNDNLIEYRSNDNNISDELEFSIFGNDIISEDENLNNDTTVKFIDGKFQVVEQDKNKINLNLNNMDNSDNTISKVEISNNENNISFEKDNSKVESSKDNYEIWGKLQPICGKTSNVITGYLFTEYDNLNDSKNVSDGYHQVKQYISIDKEQIKVSVNQTGSFGILSFNDNVYSFIACNSNIISDSKRYNITPNCAAAEKTSNNALQAVKMSQVDNYTTDTEKIAPVQPQTANKAYTNPDPNNPKVWEYIKLHLTMKQGSHLMRDVLDEYKEIEAKNIHSVIAYMEDMCKAVRSALEKGLINEMQFNDFTRVFQTLSKGKYNYWRKVFSTRSPKSLMTSEMKMWEILGKPKVVNGDDETSKVDNNKVYEDNVILPSENDFESMSLDDIKNTLLTFVQEHPNLSDGKKAYINNLCIAYTLEPQYVA